MSDIDVIYEYPLPFDRGEIIRIQKESLDGPFGLHDEQDIIEGVDEFHAKYIREMIRTDEWSVFRCTWGGSNWVYFWNYACGWGFKVRDSWEVMCAFVEMMDQFTDEYDASDFEPARYPWELP